MAIRIDYYEYKSSQLICTSCGWQGLGRDASQNYAGIVMDLECPNCFKMLAIINFPTLGETLLKGSEKDRKAILQEINFRESFKQRKLTNIDQLPDLNAKGICFYFKANTIDGEYLSIIEFRGQAIWQEPMLYESYERFMAIGNLLKQKYGKKMIDLVPDKSAETWLYGEELKAPSLIANFRKTLRK